MTPQEIQSFYRELGNRLRQCRAKHTNLSQNQLAKSVGLTRTSIVNIEQGRQRVQLHTLVQLANALNVGTSELIPASGVENDFLEPETAKDLSAAELRSILKVLVPKTGKENNYVSTATSGKKDAATVRRSKTSGTGRENSGRIERED